MQEGQPCPPASRASRARVSWLVRVGTKCMEEQNPRSSMPSCDTLTSIIPSLVFLISVFTD